MEQIIQGSDVRLLDGLKFNLGETADYITSRSNSRFYPSTASVASPAAGRTIRFELASANSWLLGGTLRLNLLFNNTDGANPLSPLSPHPMALFSRVRVFCNGTLAEDHLWANRTWHLLYLAQTPGALRMAAAEGFGEGNATPAVTDSIQADANATNFANYGVPVIPAGGSRRVCGPILSGLLTQSKALPLPFCKIAIELELVGNAADVVVSPQAPTGTGGALTAASTTWSISDMYLMADTIELDPTLSNEYAATLAKGSPLTVSYVSTATQVQTVTAANLSATLARGYSRLRGVIVTFSSTPTGATTGAVTNKPIVEFLNPKSRPGTPLAYATTMDNMDAFISVGSRVWPDIKISSLCEFYYRFRLYFNKQAAGDCCVSQAQFYNNRFAICFDLEKAGTQPGMQADFTGENTRAGQSLYIALSNIAAAADGTLPGQMYVTLLYDAVLRIGLTDASVYD